MWIAIVLAVVGAVWYRVASPKERQRTLDTATDIFLELKEAATRPRPEYDAFRDALRTRTRFVLVTPAIALVVVGVFGAMLFGATPIASPDTLVTWGANLGTRTTSGEWWRLVTSAFVHAGFLHLLMGLFALVELGPILERLVGRVAVAAVYLSAGVFTGLVVLSTHTSAVSVGATGAVFGLYGLLSASLVWQAFHDWRTPRPAEEAEGEPAVAPRARIPLVALKRLAIGAVVFFGYSALSGRAHAAEFEGLVVGLMYGVVFARRAGEKRPGARYVGYAALAAFVCALVAAAVIGRTADVKPEIAHVLALEKSTVGEYDSAFDAFKKGRLAVESLAQLADHTIVAELTRADARLEAMTGVPPEHRQVVADAREFLRLRCISWRTRASAIRGTYGAKAPRPEGVDDAVWRVQLEKRHRADLVARGSTEGPDRMSMEALQRIASF